MSEVVPLLLVVAASVAAALAWRAAQGRVRQVDDRFSGDELRGLGAAPPSWTLLEISAPGCAACRAARSVLDGVAAARADVAVVVADVARWPQLARDHHVLRTPTTFVIAPDGSVRGRISGVPHAADVLALLWPAEGAGRR